MTQELWLYDREKGLFKEILNKSRTIQGRYHVSVNGGNDLNTSNLDTFFKDPQNSLADPDQKYPICVCVTPRSRYVNLPGGRFEEFTFNLFFLCTTGRGNQQIKLQDADTLLSAHPVWYDWQDMKYAAENFIEVLKKLLRTGKIYSGNIQVPLGTVAVFKDEVIFNRLSRFNNDILTGVSITFQLYLEALKCEIEDYTDIQDIIIPSIIIHDASDDER